MGESTAGVLDTLVVGAGITGLSLARAAIARAPDRQILVAESQPRVGGNITTQTAEGFLWEEGPNSFSPNPELLELIVSVGLRDEMVLADRKLPRYVFWQGKLLPVPMGPSAAAGTSLLSAGGKARVLLGVLGFVPPAIATDNETVAQFFRRHLGREVLERLVEPFCSGVYAGDPSQLEARSAFGRVFEMAELGGGLVPGALLARKRSQASKAAARAPELDLPKTRRGELGSFRTGLQALPLAIAEKLGDRVKLQWQAKQLQTGENGNYCVDFATPEGEKRLEARSVVLTIPAYAAAHLLKPLEEKIGAGDRAASPPENCSFGVLDTISYPPVACVILAYPAAAFKTDLRGFGNLIPRRQGIRTLGTIWASSLFPDRAPQGWRMLINFIGGATDPGIAELNEEQIVGAVHQDLQKTLLRDDTPPKVLAVHLWPQAIPQYNLGHAERLATLDRGLARFPGLFVCANYLDGVALGDCVRRAKNLASYVENYLQGDR